MTRRSSLSLSEVRHARCEACQQGVHSERSYALAARFALDVLLQAFVLILIFAGLCGVLIVWSVAR